MLDQILTKAKQGLSAGRRYLAIYELYSMLKNLKCDRIRDESRDVSRILSHLRFFLGHPVYPSPKVPLYLFLNSPGQSIQPKTI